MRERERERVRECREREKERRLGSPAPVSAVDYGSAHIRAISAVDRKNVGCRTTVDQPKLFSHDGIAKHLSV
jgi:hypothetical protein